MIAIIDYDCYDVQKTTVKKGIVRYILFKTSDFTNYLLNKCFECVQK